MFRDEYTWPECSSNILNRATLLLCGEHGGERESFFRLQWEAMPATPIVTVHFEGLRNCKVTTTENGCSTTVSGSILSLLRNVLQKRDRLRSVVLDITSLQHCATMSLVSLLFEERVGELFGVYAEPAQYEMASATEFRLSDTFLGSQTVPGYARPNRNERSAVAFLGFEGERLSRILEEREQVTNLIPVLGVPSYRPGWNLNSLASAGRVVTSHDALQNLRSCPAFSVHEAIALLEDLTEKEPVIIAPLGTRPHTLATAIFASQVKKRTSIAYDHPVEHVARSVGIGETHVYHLSSYLR